MASTFFLTACSLFSIIRAKRLILHTCFHCKSSYFNSVKKRQLVCLCCNIDAQLWDVNVNGITAWRQMESIWSDKNPIFLIAWCTAEPFHGSVGHSVQLCCRQRSLVSHVTMCCRNNAFQRSLCHPWIWDTHMIY